MNKIYHFLILALLMLVTLNGMSQTNYWEQIVTQKSISIEGDTVSVTLHIVLDNLDIKSDQMFVLTPIIRSHDQSKIKELAPIVIVGGRKNKSLKRSMALSPQPVFKLEPYTIVRHRSKKKQTIDYSVKITIEDWIKNSDLLLVEDVLGCAMCDLGSVEVLLTSPLLALDEPQKSFVAECKADLSNAKSEDIEDIENGNEEHELYLTYKVGSWQLSPTFGNNQREIEKFGEQYNTIIQNEKLTITGIHIVGFASPEGTFDGNLKLSEKRSKGLASFLQEHYNIPAHILSVDWKGEDWPGLEKAIEASDIQGKERILDVIRTETKPDKRKSELMKLDAGRLYKQLQTQLFPLLRRNTCIIHFQVVRVDGEKAQ